MYERREQGLVDAFRGVETAAIPIDEPAIIYPPAEVWQALSARRKERYGAINLAGGAGGSKAEQKITAALKQVTKEIDYQGAPLRQVIQELQDEYNIPIRLNTVELGVVGVDPESPITISLPADLSLRSALRQILASVENADAGLTYTIRDEVLLITSKEDADAEPQIKVYQVGDLVVTPQMLRMSAVAAWAVVWAAWVAAWAAWAAVWVAAWVVAWAAWAVAWAAWAAAWAAWAVVAWVACLLCQTIQPRRVPSLLPSAMPKHRASAESIIDVASLIARYSKASDEATQASRR